MALTAKPISTISYNTEPHLKRLLDQYLKSGRIEDYRYIKHEGEDGDKDHIHLIVFPNRRIDTAEFRESFNEADPNGGDKPLGCLPFRSSKPDHWIMYVIHDPDYLKSHKSDNDGDGKIIYTVAEIVTPFEDQLIRDYKRALVLRNTDNQKVVNGITQGVNLVDIAVTEDINPQKVVAMMNLYRMQDAIDEMARINNQREIEANAIGHSVDALGSVRIEEDLGATKNEKKLGLTRVLERQIELDPDTDALKETDRRIVTKGGDDER